MTRDRIENTGEMSEAEIDATLADTFPASDPPSWTLGTDRRDERERTLSGQELESPLRTRAADATDGSSDPANHGR